MLGRWHPAEAALSPWQLFLSLFVLCPFFCSSLVLVLASGGYNVSVFQETAATSVHAQILG